MLHEIQWDDIQGIKNPAFATYVKLYLDIESSFKDQIIKIGLELDEDYTSEAADARRETLSRKGAILRNEGKSVYINRISPACIACRESYESATFFISLQCRRDCFYCFNPNQEHYDYFRKNSRNILSEIDQIHSSGQSLRFTALTGGEPLLHPEESVAFFKHAHAIFGDLHSRIYTSGDPIDAGILTQLREAGLQEIRFSLRLHEPAASQQATLERIRLAKEYIPSVMVEMPIFPDSFEVMKRILVELDRVQISSINLLELCFPFRNVNIFREKGFQIKYPPYRVPYEYWYAGGLPIAGSEIECLRLVEFALDEGLDIGVHYCSLENKHSGQIYQQNFGKKVSPRYHFSEKDFFYKSAKAFGKDIPPVRARLKPLPKMHTFTDSEHDYFEFHVNHLLILSDLDIEVAICSAIVEERDEGRIVRELKIQRAIPQEIDLAMDI